MKLDRDTYEAWLLDRLEGLLTPEQERDLDAFLVDNPDLGTGALDLPAVSPDAETFLSKAGLKRVYPPTGLVDEAHLNDHLAARVEGDLTAEQEQALDKFLYEHPELAQHSRRMALSKVVPGNEVFAAKSTIERHFPPKGLPDAHRLTDFLVAELEGDLDARQREALKSHVRDNQHAQRERRLMGLTRVSPEAVVFMGKEGLKKREGRVIVLWTRLAAAASIALLLGMAWWMLRGDTADEPRVAEEKRDDVRLVPRAPAPVVPAPAEAQQPAAVQQGGDKTVPGTQERAPVQAPVPSSAPEAPVRPIPAPEVMPDPTLEPQLARQPEEVPAQEPVSQPEQPDEQPATANAPVMDDRPIEGGTSVGTYLANTVRQGVLASEERSSGLDQRDAMAMVNKGLAAVTGGKGGVQVERTSARERVKLRLGKAFSITASTGR